MAATYDAIVVGGGHNGLVAAAYLARSGARTVVLEGRHKTGGAATTEAPWPEAPEFKVTRLSYVMSLMPPTIIKDLDLERTATRSTRWGRTTRRSLRAARSRSSPTTPSAIYEEIAKWSKKDADTMPQVGRLAGGPRRRARPAAADRAPERSARASRVTWPAR
jgi:phytoene dehydrogenase-like protein